jgi:hypothetical protein
MTINEEDINAVKTCSGTLWNTFKDICSAAAKMDDKEKLIDMAFVEFKQKVATYKNTPVYGYAVGYAHDLLDMLERFLYPGSIKKTNYMDVKRMQYAEFCEYLKDPNPGDLITVIQDDKDLARIKVRTVINA